MLSAKGFRRPVIVLALAFLCSLPICASDDAAAHIGYYRDPAVHGDTIVFTSEGDLWTVSAHGGAAHRLTSAPGKEDRAAISPDGQTVAFRAQYEGPEEIYTMPLDGGLPQRQTWDGGAEPVGWTPDGRLMITTTRYATLPDASLVLIGSHGERESCPSPRARKPLTPPTARLSSSPASKTREATPNATRADSSSTSGAWTATAKLFLSRQTMPVPRTIPCSGMAASTSSPIAMAS